MKKGFRLCGWLSGINGGHMLTTGFAHGAVLAHAEKVITAIKAGAIKHIFLVGGCDGAHPGRNYYTEFVKQTPMDTLVLTLACGKYRFNDLDLGEIDGLPRILVWGSATTHTVRSKWRWLWPTHSDVRSMNSHLHLSSPGTSRRQFVFC